MRQRKDRNRYRKRLRYRKRHRIETVPFTAEAEQYGSGEMILSGIGDGSWTGVFGADFGKGSPKRIVMKVRGQGHGAVRISLDMPPGWCSRV
ncbi:MAG: hypothetical protein IJT34_03670 [Butyrivibrio sp.]|nr:hypothetical protein [Butyrivibrio sp.]